MCKQELLPLFTLFELLTNFQLLSKQDHALVREHFFSDEVLPLSQLASMIVRPADIGSYIPMPLLQFWKAACIEEVKGEEEKKGDAIDSLTKIDIKKVKKFITGRIQQSSTDQNVFWQYDQKRRTVSTLIYNGGWWAWKDNKEYWDFLPEDKGFLGKPVPYLKNVCWIDIHITAEKCVPLGFKYRLYLLHGLMSKNTMKDTLKFKILVKKP